MNRKTLSLFIISFLLLLSCNKKQETQSIETLPASVEVAENDSITNPETPRKESINLFTLMPKDSSDVAFISLSDIYPAGDEKDTLVLPNLEKMGKHDAQYFTFDKNYRKRFLTKTNISETDSLFVYDYAKNKLVSFPVKNLKTAAMLNGYSSEEDWPYHNYDFMIGFEINTKYLNGFSEYYRDALVYVGKENPFVRGQIIPINWKKIAAKEYPSRAINSKDQKLLKNTKPGDTYAFMTKSYQYFLQDYMYSPKITYGRRLLVVDVKSKKIILEKFYTQSEGTSPSPLNYEEGEGIVNQWTGKLFKDKPDVLFGFLYESFGCPSISIIDQSNEEIYLQCDNRH